MAKEEFPAVFNNASNEVNGMTPQAEVVEAKPEAQAEAAVEMSSEGPEKLSAEERGRQVFEKAGERVASFKENFAAGANRLWNKIKGWPGKAAKFVGKLAATGVGGALNAADFVGDKVSEGYNSAIEKYNNGKEALGNRAEAAKQKLESGIQFAKDKFQEKKNGIKERYENYIKAREQFSEALKNLRQAQKALIIPV
jgi:hypothetical protein